MGLKNYMILTTEKKTHRKRSKQRHQSINDGETDFLSFSLATVMTSVPRRYHVPLFNSPSKYTPSSHLLLNRKTKHSLVPAHCPAWSRGSVVFVD